MTGVKKDTSKERLVIRTQGERRKVKYNHSCNSISREKEGKRMWENGKAMQTSQTAAATTTGEDHDDQ